MYDNLNVNVMGIQENAIFEVVKIRFCRYSVIFLHLFNLILNYLKK